MNSLKSIFSIVLVFFFLHLSFSQESKKSIEDSIRKNIYSNPSKALKYLHNYLKINQSENNLKGIIVTNASIAAAHEVMNQTDSTLFYHYKNLSIEEDPIDIIQTKHSIARVLEDKYRYKESLRLYYQTLTLARENNDLEYIKTIETYITSLKLRISKSNEAIQQLRKDYNYKDLNNDVNLRFVRKTLIESYIKADSLKEAEILIKKGLKEAINKNDCEYIYRMNVLKSKTNILKRNFDIAQKVLYPAFECAVKLGNLDFINEIKYKQAEISYLMNDYKAALDNLIFVDNNNTINTPLQKVKHYKLMSDTYKALNNKILAEDFYYKYLEEKQKVSDDRLATMEVLYNLNINDKVLLLEKNYKSEINQEIKQKERYKKTSWTWIIISSTLLIFIISLIFFFKNKSIKNQKRFESLMLKINTFEERKAKESKTKLDKTVTETPVELAQTVETQGIEDVKIIKQPELETETETDNAYVIDDKKVEEILIKLQNLEDKMYFLRQDCTLHNMAKKLKTNTSYLSKIINTHLDKSFSTYINELRINYAIIELKNNKRLRSYSVKGVAQEMGYKNADAFSRYFRAATGISPSVYIKKVQKV